MTERTGLTKKDLERLRQDCYRLSDRAINEHPERYRQIRDLLDYALSNQIDINDYFCPARDLAESLKEMGKGTVFHYFHENIDPNKSGRARYFRAECMDLLVQLQELNRWRAGIRKLKVVK